MLNQSDTETFQSAGADLLQGIFVDFFDGAQAAMEEKQESPSWRELAYRREGGAPFGRPEFPDLFSSSKANV